MNNFSSYFSLPVSGHKDLEFVDINLQTDIELFIDPSLIQGTSAAWCQECNIILDSFFTQVFTCCKEHTPESFLLLHQLLSFGHEPNETKLGLSTWKSRGKGTTPETLFDIFKGISDSSLCELGFVVSPMDLCVFVKNFAEDRMSDLVTNVLRKQLYDFTVQQCAKYNIKLSENPINLGHYWDSNLCKWECLMAQPLIANQNNILLVPKNIVRQSYIYSVEQYISQFVIPERQKYHEHNMTELSLKYSKRYGEHFGKPTKKLIYIKEIKGTKHKYFAQKYSTKNPDAIINFRDSMLKQASLGKFILSDEQLDYIVYSKSKQVS